MLKLKIIFIFFRYKIGVFSLKTNFEVNLGSQPNFHFYSQFFSVFYFVRKKRFVFFYFSFLFFFIFIYINHQSLKSICGYVCVIIESVFFIFLLRLRKSVQYSVSFNLKLYACFLQIIGKVSFIYFFSELRHEPANIRYFFSQNCKLMIFFYSNKFSKIFICCILREFQTICPPNFTIPFKI